MYVLPRTKKTYLVLVWLASAIASSALEVQLPGVTATLSVHFAFILIGIVDVSPWALSCGGRLGRGRGTAPCSGEYKNREPGNSGVDGNTVSLKVVEAYPKKLAWTKFTARNGGEPVDFLADYEVPVLFMNCRTPVMGGPEAAGEIRRREGEQRHTHIVARLEGLGVQSDEPDKVSRS